MNISTNISIKAILILISYWDGSTGLITIDSLLRFSFALLWNEYFISVNLDFKFFSKLEGKSGIFFCKYFDNFFFFFFNDELKSIFPSLIYIKITSSLSSISPSLKSWVTNGSKDECIPFKKGKNVSKYLIIWSDIIGIYVWTHLKGYSKEIKASVTSDKRV